MLVARYMRALLIEAYMRALLIEALNHLVDCAKSQLPVFVRR